MTEETQPASGPSAVRGIAILGLAAMAFSLAQTSIAPAPRLVGDITCLPTAEGRLCLACRLDLATREAVMCACGAWSPSTGR